MKIKLPHVYEYNNFRTFLADYQKARQATDASFSHGACSRALGLPNTRSYFSDVIKGKKVTNAFIERFVKVLELSKDESRFFRVLVLFNQAENPEERDLYFDQLISLNRTPRRILDKNVYTYYKNWYNGVIRALLHIYDFKDDYSGLSKKVFPAVTVKQTKEAIALLSKLDLIYQNPNGFFKPTEKSIATPDFVKDDFIKQYQLSCLEIAKHSLLKISAFPHAVSTNVISVSEEGYKRIEKKILKFRSEIRSLVHKDEKPAEKVYQLAVLLLPNSK